MAGFGNAFALLKDDVEDDFDLAPADPVVTTPAVPAPPPPTPVVTAEPRNLSFGERGARGWRDGERGRRGARGGRGRGGRGRGMRGRGGRDAYGAGAGSGSWDVRRSGEGRASGEGRSNDDIPQLTSESGPSTVVTPPVALKAENADDTREEDTTEEKKEEDRPAPAPKEKEMTLDEYMAKKAAMQLGMRSLSTKSARKANDGQVGYGGKMAVLKKKDDGKQTVDETSIMSAVQMKQAVENRSTVDSTHAAVASNAKNQEFFKTPVRSSGNRPYQGRDARVNGNGDFRRGGDRQSGGFKGGNRGGRFEGRENRYRGSGFNRNSDDHDENRGNRDSYNRQRSGAPNVDDQSAFPSLSA